MGPLSVARDTSHPNSQLCSDQPIATRYSTIQQYISRAAEGQGATNQMGRTVSCAPLAENPSRPRSASLRLCLAGKESRGHDRSGTTIISSLRVRSALSARGIPRSGGVERALAGWAWPRRPPLTVRPAEWGRPLMVSAQSLGRWSAPKTTHSPTECCVFVTASYS